MRTMEILTERLCLKEYDKSCINDFYKLKSCPSVWTYSTFVPVQSMGEAELLLNEQIVSRQQNKGGFMPLYKRDNGQYIGEAGIISINRNADRCEIGYNLLPEFWNQGYATEIATKLVLHAINALKFERVEALVLSDNKASCRVMEKCGFKCEGILRHFNKHDDNYRDVNYYGIISSDINSI
ncbi:ribosomal-protein-alanine N-acetyltransferase [Lacrimispora xylanisolvens]|uniref:Ribosomal-protein-alanine N-acetyltransferase n=1 Tax=Lacrimispora xylanisolvens TaxID=384636 RepID=A0A2S6HY32_9FIRM|nr:GNAT family protein [Hungatella xylanolytica]PPK82980.1 ribosomal-protein-alanine N-acetyltransferase [Hungatella xylanolytica]